MENKDKNIKPKLNEEQSNQFLKELEEHVKRGKELLVKRQKIGFKK